MEDIFTYFPFFLVFILCGSIHEFCHAWTAYRLGDTTARDLGRMKLNPLVHIDLMGTVLFPMLTLYTMGLPFGWMKPVPVSPQMLRNPRKDMFLVSMAGPYSNLFLAFLGFVVLFVLEWTGSTASSAMKIWIWINLLLAFFNMLPVPPLDGSSIVDFIRGNRGGSYHAQGYIGIVFLFVVLVFGLRFLGIAIEATCGLMYSIPVLPFAVFFALLLIAVLFHVKTSRRSTKMASSKTGASKLELAYETAGKIGAKLARGETLIKAEQQWLDKVRSDTGDGSDLCADVSFSPENDFCEKCRNFNRCAARLVKIISSG